MAWIETIGTDESDNKLKKLYTNSAGARGAVAEVQRIKSLNPCVWKRISAKAAEI